MKHTDYMAIVKYFQRERVGMEIYVSEKVSKEHPGFIPILQQKRYIMYLFEGGINVGKISVETGSNREREEHSVEKWLEISKMSHDKYVEWLEAKK